VITVIIVKMRISAGLRPVAAARLRMSATIGAITCFEGPLMNTRGEPRVRIPVPPAASYVAAVLDADRYNPGTFRSRMITLKVHSSLQAFGMLAAVSARLAAACAYHFSWNINANKHSGFLQLHRQNASSVGGFISQS
jgi:hypothetical protein